MRILLHICGYEILDLHIGTVEPPAQESEPYDSGHTASTPIGYAPPLPPPNEADFPDRL